MIEAYTHDMSLHRHITKDEWQRIHNRSAGIYQNGEWVRETLLGVSKARQAHFSNATGHVLDVACGYGMNFGYLSNASQVTGVDFSPVMIDRARSHASQLGLSVNIQQGDAEALDFADHTFDTVISALSTCSFLNPIEALQEMKRVVKPGGQILLLEHGRSSWEWLGKYQDNHVEQQIEQGGCRWNQEPQKLIEEAGLNIVAARRSMLGILHTVTVRS